MLFLDKCIGWLWLKMKFVIFGPLWSVGQNFLIFSLERPNLIKFQQGYLQFHQMAFIVNKTDFYGNLGRYSWKTGVYLYFPPKIDQGLFDPFLPK